VGVLFRKNENTSDFLFPSPPGRGIKVKGIAEFPGGGSGMAVHFAQEYAFRRGEIKR